jgi:hypothetical protein
MMGSLFIATLGLLLSIGSVPQERSPVDSTGAPSAPDCAASPVVQTDRLIAPQQEIEIQKGRHLNLLCLGSGTPTVIFESGTGGATAAASSPCLDDPPNANLALHRALNLIESRPAYAAALLSEFESTFRKVDGITLNDSEVPLQPLSLGNIPLTVLTASRHPATPIDFTAEDQTKYYAFWKAGHDRLAALSSCGRNLVVPDSSHFIQYDQPQILISYILAVVDLSKTSARKTCAAGSMRGVRPSLSRLGIGTDKRRWRLPFGNTVRSPDSWRLADFTLLFRG